jgi:hypothetical protein
MVLMKISFAEATPVVEERSGEGALAGGSEVVRRLPSQWAHKIPKKVAGKMIIDR